MQRYSAGGSYVVHSQEHACKNRHVQTKLTRKENVCLVFFNRKLSCNAHTPDVRALNMTILNMMLSRAHKDSDPGDKASQS